MRDYQSEGSDFLVPRKRGMVIAPAGSGKTIIGAHALSRVLRPGMKVTWIANTKEQVEQAGEAIGRMPGPSDVEIDIVCAAGNPETGDSDIVVFDECHHVPAVTWLDAAVKAKDKIIWGLTATPWHDDEIRNIVVKTLFNEFFRIERDRVLASGHLVEGKVWMHDLDLPGQFDKEIEEKVTIEVLRRARAFRGVPIFEHQRRAQWQITQEFVQANGARNSKIVDLIHKCTDSTLVLIHSIDHGDFLATAVPGSLVVHSKLPKKKRTKAIEDFRSGALRVMFATSLADEGLDVPRASCLILAAGGRSAGKLEQRAGRVLRPFEGKESGIIHDFMDRGCLFALAQARARMKVYEDLGYEPLFDIPLRIPWRRDIVGRWLKLFSTRRRAGTTPIPRHPCKPPRPARALRTSSAKRLPTVRARRVRCSTRRPRPGTSISCMGMKQWWARCRSASPMRNG